MKRVTHIIAALVVTGLLSSGSHAFAGSCGADKECSAAKCSSKDLVTLASGAEGFKTLVVAVKAAGLVETLQGEGPFTIFAPTDEAFAKLPAGTLENLLKPENRDKLVAVLKYHVVPGRLLAADVRSGQATTAQGQKVSLQVSDKGVKVDNAKVIKTDLIANNGVIHVIDTVILPKS